jgi:transcription antitermination factor NusG
MLMATELRSDRAGVLSQSEPDGPAEWSMIVVWSGRELETSNAFRRFGIRCYWPNYCRFGQTATKRRGRRRSGNYASLIPGYLFIPLPHTANFEEVAENCEGFIHTVLTYSGDIFKLKNQHIEAIRRIAKVENTPAPKPSLHNFKTGDKVRLVDDTFGHLPPGRVAGLADNGRIDVEIKLMERAVPFHVLAHQIERM